MGTYESSMHNANIGQMYARRKKAKSELEDINRQLGDQSEGIEMLARCVKEDKRKVTVTLKKKNDDNWVVRDTSSTRVQRQRECKFNPRVLSKLIEDKRRVVNELVNVEREIEQFESS